MRAVIADDELLLREGVARLLEEAGIEVVAQAGDAPDLLRKVAAHKPDVAIVDVRMPPDLTDDGLRAALEIRHRQPEVGVVVLSQHLVERFVAELVGDDARGVGYLLKHRVADLGVLHRGGPDGGERRHRAGPGGRRADARAQAPRRPAGRAHAARARGAAADGRRALQPGDRRPADGRRRPPWRST